MLFFVFLILTFTFLQGLADILHLELKYWHFGVISFSLCCLCSFFFELSWNPSWQMCRCSLVLSESESVDICMSNFTEHKVWSFFALSQYILSCNKNINIQVGSFCLTSEFGWAELSVPTLREVCERPVRLSWCHLSIFRIIRIMKGLLLFAFLNCYYGRTELLFFVSWI